MSVFEHTCWAAAHMHCADSVEATSIGASQIHDAQQESHIQQISIYVNTTTGCIFLASFHESLLPSYIAQPDQAHSLAPLKYCVPTSRRLTWESTAVTMDEDAHRERPRHYGGKSWHGDIVVMCIGVAEVKEQIPVRLDDKEAGSPTAHAQDALILQRIAVVREMTQVLSEEARWHQQWVDETGAKQSAAKHSGFTQATSIAARSCCTLMMCFWRPMNVAVKVLGCEYFIVYELNLEAVNEFEMAAAREPESLVEIMNHKEGQI
ncbi:uncharacterized protein EV420DRAFT_1486540 [Desarmillaria tabescens]|uniref:Uncharacterized protein n=1 Tax=Armillaria tabescens TaxID=1929756 RepID=A0AA39MM85_ARMTA|nr:uncharacterized protein EV420DRAFT_1486540 [Desarmillaria tabescens]KAK0438889.1 hypothetical protein EV420DRAFT_1486540 [Desarmillaria tabescens]